MTPPAAEVQPRPVSKSNERPEDASKPKDDGIHSQILGSTLVGSAKEIVIQKANPVNQKPSPMNQIASHPNSLKEPKIGSTLSKDSPNQELVVNYSQASQVSAAMRDSPEIQHASEADENGTNVLETDAMQPPR